MLSSRFLPRGRREERQRLCSLGLLFFPSAYKSDQDL